MGSSYYTCLLLMRKCSHTLPEYTIVHICLYTYLYGFGSVIETKTWLLRVHVDGLW